MQPMIDLVTNNPLYGAGLVLLLLLLIVSLTRRAVKLVVVAIALNAGYGYYLHDMAQTTYDQASRAVKDAAAQTGDMMRLK